MGRLETPSLLVREKISQNFAHAKIGICELPAVGIGEIGSEGVVEAAVLGAAGANHVDDRLARGGIDRAVTVRGLAITKGAREALDLLVRARLLPSKLITGEEQDCEPVGAMLFPQLRKLSVVALGEASCCRNIHDKRYATIEPRHRNSSAIDRRFC